MSNIKALRQRAQDLKTKMRALLDKAAAETRELNEAEAAEYEMHLTALRSADNQVAREEHLLDIERNAPAVDDPKAVVPNQPAKPGFQSLGEFLVAVCTAGRTDGRVVDPRLMAAASGMNEAIPSDGGFLIPPDFSSEILRRLYDIGAILKRTRKVNVTGNALKINAVDETSRVTGSRWGGVQAYWANESDTVTASKPKFRQLNLNLNKVFALYYATDELLADTSALGSIADEAFAEELNFMVEDAIFEGDGAGKPLGILNSPAIISVAKETSQPNTTIVAENVLKMYSRMFPRSRSSAAWFVNQDVMPQLPQFNVKIKNVAGSENVGGILTPIYQFPSGPDNYGTILGLPVIPIEYASTLGTKGDIVLADFSQYLMIDKGGVQAASSMHVRFINDEMTFRVTYRVDGQPIWNKPLTPFKGSSTQSPFVTLDPRP